MAEPPRSSSPANATAPQRSHGRGGAGNISSRGAPPSHVDELTTPTIKAATYTTGRGGSGNMAALDSANPERARAAQDVDTPVHHERDMRGTYHWGRGGEGNMMYVGKPSAEEKEKEREKQAEAIAAETAGNGDAEVGKGKEVKGLPAQRQGLEQRRSSFQGVVERGREMLGLVRKSSKERNVNKEEK